MHQPGAFFLSVWAKVQNSSVSTTSLRTENPQSMKLSHDCWSHKLNTVRIKVDISVRSNRVTFDRQSQLEKFCGIRCTYLARYVN
jgi:hypothetical protein